MAHPSKPTRLREAVKVQDPPNISSVNGLPLSAMWTLPELKDQQADTEGKLATGVVESVPELRDTGCVEKDGKPDGVPLL